MEWFDGSIAAAIQTAKLSKSLFVVIIHGPEDDETSQKFLDILNSPEVSSKLQRPRAICIKLQNGTQALTQFSQIYPVILIPSIYFIDSATGVNTETTGGAADKDKILESIDKALAGAQNAAAIASPRGERVEQARQILQNETGGGEAAGSSQESSTPTTSMSLEERVDRAKRMLAEKQAQKDQEEKSKEKNSEMERRDMGRNVQALKRKQEDDEIRKAAEERQKDKEEQRLARIKIKEQIAQDRAERAEKFNKEKAEREEKRKEVEKERLAEEARKAEQLAAERSTVARIQFRLPNGVSQSHRFSPDDTLGDLYRFVMEEMTTPYGSNVSLTTTFPSRQLDNESPDTSLRQAGLVPSTTILILPRSSGGRIVSTSADGSIMSYIWLLLTPLTALWGLINSIFASSQPSDSGNPNENRKRQANSDSTSGSSGGKRRSAGIRTEGNIARLGGNDDDDENNTYNGNSTQQM